MKLAILGTENSHAYAFAKLLHDDPKYADIQLVGVYGYDKAANDRIVNEGLAPCAAAAPEEFLGKVDGILVTARHGDLHCEYALPYVQQGLPAFIDKPFTVDPAKAELLLNAAKAAGAPLCGGSSLKHLEELRPLREYLKEHTPVGGYVTAPVNMVNEYGDFYFYAQHLTECLIAVWGEGVKAVRARRPVAEANRVSAVFDYGSFDVAAQYSDAYVYAATVLCRDGCLSASCSDPSYCYQRELDEFIEMARTGQMPRSYEQLAYPARLLHCIEEAYLTDKEVSVPW